MTSGSNSLSRMYHLMKTHKIPSLLSVAECRSWLEQNGWPTREIISGSGSPTERISSLINFVLTPGMKSLPSYLQDTKHLLQIVESLNDDLKNEQFSSGNMAWLSLDVVSLYPSMPKELGRTACEKYLKSRNDQTISTSSVLGLLDLCLDNNYFEFNEELYLQTAGVPIGPCMAPPYACLGMGEFENIAFNDSRYLEEHSPKIYFWKRFIDDVLTLYEGTEEEAEQFVCYLNSLFPGVIRFTHTYNKLSIVFLDVELVFRGQKIDTKLQVKPTNLPMFLDWNSKSSFALQSRYCLFSSFENSYNLF